MACGNFTYSQIVFKKYASTSLTYARGEITNNSSRDYNTAVFRLSVFDDKTLVWTGMVKIRGLRRRQSKTFQMTLDKADFNTGSKVIKCEICFETAY